jgi:hypothetical protein
LGEDAWWHLLQIETQGGREPCYSDARIIKRVTQLTIAVGFHDHVLMDVGGQAKLLCSARVSGLFGAATSRIVVSAAKTAMQATKPGDDDAVSSSCPPIFCYHLLRQP